MALRSIVYYGLIDYLFQLHSQRTFCQISCVPVTCLRSGQLILHDILSEAIPIEVMLEVMIFSTELLNYLLQIRLFSKHFFDYEQTC
jgi:hypothetical protein